MEKNTKIIALAGKGGVGKTSLSALTVRLLAERHPGSRILAIDADPAVEAVTTLFITDPRFPFGELEALLLHTENITKALDHLLQNVKMDCHSCSLKEVCAEVEQLHQSELGMKE